MSETQLTPATVGGGKFHLLFNLAVDGTVQAQPLFMPGVMINGAPHNVLFVATEHDSVYAFDADGGGSPLWTVSLGMPVPSGGGPYPWACMDLVPESGISATPVLDPNAGILYIISETLEGNTYHHRLHALDVTTGKDKIMPSPGTTPGGKDITPPQPEWTAAPANHHSRVGLLLDQGTVYGAFSSHCDGPAPWYGWVVAYDAATLALKGSFKTGTRGGIWQSGMGLTTDGNGGIYFVTGTGSTAACSPTNICQAVGRLTLGSNLTMTNLYQPPAGSPAMNGGDLDLTTAFVLPPSSDFNYGFASGKDGTIHVVDRTTLKSVQEMFVVPPGSITGSGIGGHVHGGPVYWNGSMGPRLYVLPEANPLKVYSLSASGLSATPVSQVTKLPAYPPGITGTPMPDHPGAILTVSSNGKTPKTGVLWASMAVDFTLNGAWHGIVNGALYAFDAEDPGGPNGALWNTLGTAADDLGKFAKFCPPTVINGKVYIGTAKGTMGTGAVVRVYGLMP
jgi:hypothetical protein